MENISPAFKRRVRNLMNMTKSYRSWQEYFFNLTYKCPLACKYCYINPELEDMTFEEVDYIMGELSKDKTNYSRTITFFGGEPCLKIDIMEKIIPKYADLIVPGENEPRFRFGVITGFSINQERLLKLYDQHPFEIVISYDNPANNQRITHGEEPFDAWAKFKTFDVKKYTDRVFLQKTLHGREVSLSDDIKELWNIYKTYGVKFCWAHNKTPFDDFDYDKFFAEYRKVIVFLIDEILKSSTEYIPKIFTTEWLRANHHYESNCGGCGLMTELFISHNSRIYPCSISNSINPFFELSDEDVSEDISDAENMYLDNDICSKCLVNYFCNGGCLVHRHQVHGNYSTPIDNWCKYIKEVEKAYQSVISELDNETIQTITNRCIAWKMGYYRMCSSAIDNNNILGGNYR